MKKKTCKDCIHRMNGLLDAPCKDCYNHGNFTEFVEKTKTKEKPADEARRFTLTAIEKTVDGKTGIEVRINKTDIDDHAAPLFVARALDVLEKFFGAETMGKAMLFNLLSNEDAKIDDEDDEEEDEDKE